MLEEQDRPGGPGQTLGVGVRDRRTLVVQVSERIKQLIKTGEYGPATRLPSEGDLSDQYGVGRSTIREAVKVLEHEGLVDVRRGQGRFVSGQASTMLKLTQPLTRFQSVTSLLSELGYEVDVKLWDIEVTTPGPELQKALAITPVDEVVHVSRMRSERDEPLVFSEAMILPEMLGVPLEKVDWTRSILAMMEEAGHTLALAVSEIASVRLPKEVQERIDSQVADDPWLLIEETCMDEAGRPILFARDYFRGEKFSFTVSRRNEGVALLG